MISELIIISISNTRKQEPTQRGNTHRTGKTKNNQGNKQKNRNTIQPKSKQAT